MLFHQGFDVGAVGLEEALELFGRGQMGEVAGDKDAVVHPRGGELNFDVVFVAAQENADGRLFIGAGDVLFPPVEVEVHLSGVAVLKRPDLEVEEDMAAEVAMVEDEVDVVVVATDGDASLPGFEEKAGAEFQEEMLEVVEEGGFEVALGVVGQFGQTGKLEDVGIADEVFNGGR